MCLWLYEGVRFLTVSWLKRKWLAFIPVIARACVHGTNCQIRLCLAVRTFYFYKFYKFARVTDIFC